MPGASQTRENSESGASNTFIVPELSDAFGSVLQFPNGEGYGDRLSFTGRHPSVGVRDDGHRLGGFARVIFIIGHEDDMVGALDEIFDLSSEEEYGAEWMLGMIRPLPLKVLGVGKSSGAHNAEAEHVVGRGES